MAETPRLAHLGVLLFFASGLATLACIAMALVAALAKALPLARIAGAAGASILGGYAVLLLAVGLASPNRTLAAGSWKYFCEADCHIAYQIAKVEFASTLGPESQPAIARGRFVIVRLKTWFDEHSIAPFRGDAPLTPDQRTVELVDDGGHRYLPVSDLPAALEQGSTPIREPLRPGESYFTTFVFDLPSAAEASKLLITDQEPVSRLLLDHENSPLHGKIYLSLASTAPARR
jgi:hypothetical protein